MQTIHISHLMSESGVGFGTSGARGLVSKMTDQVCYAYTRAFLQYLQTHSETSVTAVAISGDLRPSSPRIIAAVAQASREMGIAPVYCGLIPSPAVALYGMTHHMPAIMVTGSHIPDDRNGIKFNTPLGEITKQDEQGIREQAVELDETLFDGDGCFLHAPDAGSINNEALQEYKNRYLNFFDKKSFQGLTIGVYQHSGVARDLLQHLLEELGATVIALGRSEVFVPVDTEAIREEDQALASQWAAEHTLQAIVSTDGDADRPLISDEAGHWLRGDAVGALCSRYLGVKHVVTPVSSNTAVDSSGWFATVLRTRIGSPYVIAGMDQLSADGDEMIAGYEANGGFLQQDTLSKNGKNLSPLPTRDAVIVLLSLIAASREKNIRISELVATLPERYTYSDRVKNIPSDKSLVLIESLQKSHESIETFFNHAFGKVSQTNQTDGLRVTFESGDIIHLRPSGNAPELRCYSESGTIERARQINKQAIEFMKSAV